MRVLRRFRVLALACFLAACGANAPPPQTAADLAVLHWTLETGSGRFLGSATAFGPARLLTNRHVVEAARGAPIVARQGGMTVPVTQILPADTIDAAMLGVAHQGIAMPVVRHLPPTGTEALHAMGAVGGVVQTTTGRAVTGREAAAFGGAYIVASLPVAPGFSGGPVTDGAGQVVGIVAAAVVRTRDEALLLSAARGGGAIAQRTALLIPISTVIAQAVPVQP